MEAEPMIIAPHNIEQLREEFPLLHQKVNGSPLIYLDNAATTQKPLYVIESITNYYTGYNANIHRGVHHLANLATDAFEKARNKVKRFISASTDSEIIFTSGTTDAINLVAQTFGKSTLQKGDEILLSVMEHHSNIVPWQMVAESTGAKIRVIPITSSGEWDLSALDTLIGERTRIVAVNHVSNALGTINPVKILIDKAHIAGAKVLIDGAQAIAHIPVHVGYLDCDFYCFSGHKMYGPTGTGVLYGKKELLEMMPPYRGGGEMIETVSFENTTFNRLPHKFEAGTPNIEGVIALGAAIEFIEQLGWEWMNEQEELLLQAATEMLHSIEGVKIYGTSKHKVPVVSFLAEGIHPYDLGTLLDKQGIAVRTGHHCTQPLWDWYKISGTLRASFSVYNNLEEIGIFKQALLKAISLLK